MSHQRITRKKFIGGVAATAATVQIVPRHVVAKSGQTPPSEKLNVAVIGAGGRGAASVNALSGQNMIALCDVDQRRAAGSFKKHPQAKQYRDFRVMFDELDKSIDTVAVGTPDHTHAIAAMHAIKRGKHVYCEKPLAHSIHEIRALMKAAREHKVVTQLGNQGHSFESIRLFCEWVWDGAIGDVHTIHAACSANHCKIDQLPRLKEKHDVPKELDWNLWQGPAAERAYHPVYLPGNWRGWMPYGSGTIGDWVCHVVDPVFWALDLGAPTSVQAQAKDYDPVKHADTFPNGSVITFEFPAKGKRGAVKLVWYDGTEAIPRPPMLEPNRKPVRTGAVVYGSKGAIMYGSHGAGSLRIIPEENMKAYQRPAKTLPRVRDHHVDFVEAIRKGRNAGSNFDYGGPLTEIAQIGIIATRLLGQKLMWDGEHMRFTNSEEANRYINPPARKGWAV